MPNFLSTGLKVVHKIEDAVLVTVLASLLALASIDIIARLVFGGGVVWIQPALRVMVLWLGLLGAMLATRSREHIAIDLVNRLAPASINQLISVFTLGFSAFICGLIAWHSAAYVELAKEFGDTVMGDMPAWPFQLIIPFSFSLMALRFLLQALGNLTGHPLKPETTTESH
ncbi:MAG: TRAP transporter small permease [Oceanobacter sp.]